MKTLINTNNTTIQIQITNNKTIQITANMDKSANICKFVIIIGNFTLIEKLQFLYYESTF